ncbi:RadC family protein [Bacteroidota bacterium]
MDLFTPHISEVQINYRSKFKLSECPKVSCSKDAYDQLIRLWPDDICYKESFLIMVLNRANKIIGYSVISSGGTSGTVSDPKIIFQIALKTNANSIILAHNHPSGNKQPSDADIKLTQKLKQGGQILDISVLDHLIITDETYYSMADEGVF